MVIPCGDNLPSPTASIPSVALLDLGLTIASLSNVMVNYRGNNAAILPQPNLNISTSQHSSNQGATGGQATESGNDLGDSSSEQDEDKEEEEEEESTHAGHGADVADVAPMRLVSSTFPFLKGTTANTVFKGPKPDQRRSFHGKLRHQ